MDRFFNHWQQLFVISTAAKHFLQQHAEVVTYSTGDHFMQFGERRPFWCFVLEGMVYGYILLEDGRRRILWFASPMQGFTTVRHLYTRRLVDHAIQFAMPSVILRISALHMREAKERFPEVGELLHIQKQRYIDRRERLIRILAQPDTFERYAAFLAAFPEIASATNSQQQADFLNMGRTMLFEVRKYALKEK